MIKKIWHKHSPQEHILLVDKPTGPTSFGIVYYLRKQLGIKKIGHAGTLDPMASGLLITGITRDGTRQMQDFVGLSKIYRAHILLGTQTDTGDREGVSIKEDEVASTDVLIQRIQTIEREDIVRTHHFPVPQYSAIKVDGKPLYWYARKGIKPPHIPVKEMEVLSYQYNGMVEYSGGIALDMTLEVSSGSYIRTLGEYIAEKVGTVGHLVYLHRTSIGEYHVDDALPLAYTDGVIHDINQHVYQKNTMRNKGIIALITLIVLVGAGLLIAQKDTPSDRADAHNREENNNESMTQDNTDVSIEPTHNITISTSGGDITLELYGKATPVTVDNFVKLAQEGFYDDTRFHRIIDGFMIQAGDPNTRGGSEEVDAQWGTGGPGYTFEDELMRGGLTNEPGTLAMANAGPGTNGSQFFINVADNSNLDTRHTVFGRVIDGMDIVTELSQVATIAADRPEVDVVLQGIAVTTLSTAIEE